MADAQIYAHLRSKAAWSLFWTKPRQNISSAGPTHSSSNRAILKRFVFSLGLYIESICEAEKGSNWLNNKFDAQKITYSKNAPIRAINMWLSLKDDISARLLRLSQRAEIARTAVAIYKPENAGQ